ncbi:MATE family efflux transporter [Leptolyngbya sp. FACHB-541]|uniref:MATE family efflux transporter n=1 Tax=Leptolyngbya sp. FACHB-541 TaxID=2692810 RepID=UPI00168830D0|nr:MATE family efflux transporter [Leptolyngbya sp. FACHB-541]MBD1998726.1 MATE family efflux transporter [Leptolyngbya sp. FACHB-541]
MASISISPVRSEIKAFLHLAIPLVSAQIAQSATGFVDTVMMGHLGWKALASGGLASFTFQVFLNVLGGVVMAVSPLVAEAYGAGRKTRIEQATQQGLWLTIGLSIATMWVIAHLDTVMLRLGQTPETVTLSTSYLNVMLWGLFPAVGFAMLRGVVSGLSQARPIMIIVIGGTLFNIVGNYALGFGKFGFPRMELAGLALASALSWWGMFLSLVIYLLKHPQLRIYNLFQTWYRPKFNLLRELLIIGTPIGVSIAFEYGLVLVMTYLMGILGTDVLAAHQIALQTGIIVFMIPLGMSFAATARVGQWFGQQKLERTKEAGYISIGVALAVTTLVAIALLIFRQQVVGLYLDVHDPENVALLKLVIPMLMVVAIGHVFDGVQKTTLGALYGLQDTRIPVAFGILAFVGIGLVSGYVLGFHFGFGGVGLWAGYYLGSTTAAAIYIWRFGNLISRKIEKLD